MTGRNLFKFDEKIRTNSGTFICPPLVSEKDQKEVHCPCRSLNCYSWYSGDDGVAILEKRNNNCEMRADVNRERARKSATKSAQMRYQSPTPLMYCLAVPC